MKAGVYQARNLLNGNRYIGSSIDIQDRWREHRNDLKNYCHHSIKLQRAWNKYGEENFVFEVLLYCDPENCLMYEQIALDYFKPEYNIAMIALAPMAGRKHTEETKAQYRKNRKGQNVSIPLSEEHKARLRGPRPSMQGKNNHKVKLTIEQILLIRDLIGDGYTCVELGKKFGVHRTTISKIKHNKLWTSAS